jgi:inner membrane protein
MVALWTWRWAEHAQAWAMLEHAPLTTEPVTRMALQPYPINPFRWHAILETANYYQTAEVNTHAETIDSDAQDDLMYKPENTAAVQAAKRTFLGPVYLDWGTWAVVATNAPRRWRGSYRPRLRQPGSGTPSSSAICDLPIDLPAEDGRGPRQA